VRVGFPDKIMIEQKHGTRWRFEEKPSRSRTVNLTFVFLLARIFFAKVKSKTTLEQIFISVLSEFR